MNVAIYGLFDPRDAGDIRGVRYIGRKLVGRAGLVPALRARLLVHVSADAGTSRRARWIRHLKAIGLRPLIRPLFVVAREQAAWCEQHCIRRGLDRGWPLTNERTDSRHRPIGFKHSDETRRRISEGRRGKGLGVGHDAEWRQAVSAANRGRVCSPETRAKISAAARARQVR